mgnify:CR=1 FL=1
MADGMMTYDNPNGTWGLNNGYNISEAPEELREALSRLHAYEKTGLSVECVMEIKSMYDEAMRKNGAILKAVGKINSVNIVTTLSKPENIAKVFRLAREIQELFAGTEEKAGIEKGKEQ